MAGCVGEAEELSALEHLRRAAEGAVREAGLGPSIDGNRAGTVVAFSKGDVRALAEMQREGVAEGVDWTRFWPSGAAAELAGRFQFGGPCLAPIAACASGVVAVIQGAGLIEQGVCDVVLAGAGDSAVEPLVLAALRQMRVMPRLGAEDDPARAVRPFDRRRSGFLPGEGAGLVVLESEAHAKRRGLAPVLELAGGMFGSDAYHLTDLDPRPEHLARLMALSLAQAGLLEEGVDLVHLHGTATAANDRLEARALRETFGRRKLTGMVGYASKPQIGHLLGASGAVELVLTAQALRDQRVPPTLNREEPDPECLIRFEEGEAQERALRSAMKLAIGFGGHLASAVIRRVCR